MTGLISFFFFFLTSLMKQDFKEVENQHLINMRLERS